MELDINDLYTFITVSVISSVCITIGVGGGILYVPILGYIFNDIAYGVYLSKLSVLISSSLGLLYHLFHDIFAKNDASEAGQTPPRIHILLAISIIPWCIIGSFFGVTIHFMAKKYLKILLTTFVSITATISVCKLVRRYMEKKAPETEPDEKCPSQSPSQENIIEEQEEPSVATIAAYDISEIHGDVQRIVGCFIIVGMLVVYYLSLNVPCKYFAAILRVVCILVGLFYSAKIRKSMEVKYVQQTVGACSQQIRKFFSNAIVRIIVKIMVAVLCGLLSGTIGIGAGIFLIPLLQFLLLPPLSVAATSNLLTLVMAVSSTLKFKTTIKYTYKMVIPTVSGSLIGSGASIFFIRSVVKDKFSDTFINMILFSVCTMSIILTWTL